MRAHPACPALVAARRASSTETCASSSRAVARISGPIARVAPQKRCRFREQGVRQRIAPLAISPRREDGFALSRDGGGGDGPIDRSPRSWGGRDDDGDDEGAELDARRFNAWMKFLVVTLVARWATLRFLAWNDRPLYDESDGDSWRSRAVSVVIPARNESKAIGPTIRLLRRALEPAAAEIIVSVGDSVDDTAAIARANGATMVVSGASGRARQMNEGARHATGDYILFLHADTSVPLDVVDVIRRQLRDQKTVVGGFVSLIETTSRTFWAISYHNVIKTDYCAVISRPFAYLRGFRILFGDQAMFVRRDDFQRVRGFDESLPIMEDADLCVRMHLAGRGEHRGRVKLLDRVVTTSGRRIERLGNIKATAVHVLIACAWNFGVGEKNLRKIYDWCYRDVR